MKSNLRVRFKFYLNEEVTIKYKDGSVCAGKFLIIQRAESLTNGIIYNLQDTAGTIIWAVEENRIVRV